MPEIEYFNQERPLLGQERVGIVLGGLELFLEGLDSDLADRLRERFGVYLTDHPVSEQPLLVQVYKGEKEYFIDPPPQAELNPVMIRCDGDRVRYMGYRVAGWFDTLGGSGQLVLARGEYEPPDRAVENYIRAAVAWRAASMGGALVHSAGAVLNGRGYLFFGPSGAGKSTLSDCNTRAEIISDDLTLVLPDSEGCLELVGAPFQKTYEGRELMTGRYPLVAGFRLVQDTVASVRKVHRVQVFGELVGNFPFVAEAYKDRPDLFESMETAFRNTPLYHLHFRKDDSYWDAILGERL
jgi:hypothetical protein